ncbi:MAG: hypothetical protein A2Y15_08385 [Clostridiales bacterium GWF2_36_10]|nr:MAG: hypothetical protein A2Y15_08385 [Clostridiales bacterium GWF2_36_10]HAN20319.1 hypothetical protein [Clostridiales bacterium]
MDNKNIKHESTKKEKLGRALLICIPLLIVIISIFIPLFTDDLDVKVLYNEVFLNIDFALIALFLIIYLIYRIIKKNVKSLILNLILIAGLCFFIYNLYLDAGNATKDLVSEDLYITSVVEEATSGNDGRSSTVIFINDDNVYNLWQLETNIVDGKTYKFKFYKNSNLLYLIEEVKGK